MSWGDKEQGKIYSKQYYQQHKEKFTEYNKKYREEHREELQAKRKSYNKRYEEKQKVKREEEERQLSDAEKEQRENMSAVSKEEWLERYGYPMGDTSGWEDWQGWDRRIRRGDYE